MPTHPFTARWVQAIKPGLQRVEYFDEAFTGLVLRIEPSGRKTWRVAFRAHGRWRRMNIGSVALMDLAEARKRAQKRLGEVADGHDPASERQADREAGTFAELAHEYIERHAKKHKRSWKEDLHGSTHKKKTGKRPHLGLVKRLGPMKVKEITRRDIRAILDEIADRAPIMANRTLALVRRMFNFAIEHDWVESNPCQMVKRLAPERQRDRVLSEDEIRRFWAALEDEQPIVAALFRLRLLTAQRGGEIHGAAWTEMDLDRGWWTIPKERSKNGLAHRVPLSPPAVKILKALKKETGDSPWVCPSTRKTGPHINHAQKAIERVVQRSRVEFRGHDLRRTAASLMIGSGIPRLVVSKILNHVETGVTAVYDRHSYDAEKRAALDFWGKRVEAIIANKRDTKVLLFKAR
ncbi:MAG: tyrosine-type recombinase/integrase [Vicinamibacterales bacterium]